jgi:hypothetical protein
LLLNDNIFFTPSHPSQPHFIQLWQLFWGTNELSFVCALSACMHACLFFFLYVYLTVHNISYGSIDTLIFFQLNILETGHVSMEFFKRKGDQERVAEIFVVSGDGKEVT